MIMLPFVYDDGGRGAHFRGRAGDCVTRAIAIATGEDYKAVYDEMAAGMARLPKGRRASHGKRSARNGVSRKVYEPYLKARGWEWHPTMSIGSGCTTHLRANEIPMEGPVIVRLSHHLSAVIDGVVHDTADHSRDGTRCVYGWWTPPKEESRRRNEE